MRRSVPSYVSVMAVLLSATALRAASLPAESICEDAVAVVWVDAEKLDITQLDATAKALLGDNSKGLENSIKQLGALREAFLQIGGRGLAIIVRGPDERGRDPEPHFVVTFKDGSDPQVLTDMLKLTAGDDIAITSGGKQALIVARRERLLPPAGKEGATVDAFNNGLGKIGDAPAAVVFVPNDALRKAAADGVMQAANEGEKFMPGVTNLYKLLAQLTACERGIMTARLGDKAALSLMLTAQDTDGAKALIESLKPAVEVVNKAEQQVRDQGGIADARITMLSVLLNSIEPERDGRDVTVTFEGKKLEHVASTLAKGVFAGRARAQEMVIATNIRQLSVAIHAYATDHKGQLPDSLDDLKEYVGGGDALAKLVANPMTGEKEGVKYVKPADSLNKLDYSTQMLFEVRNGEVNKNGFVGYADGSVRRTTPNQNPAPDDSSRKQ